MDFTLKIWRQASAQDKGQFVNYKVANISDEASFLEMLDILNEDLVVKGDDPVVFDHDCREGICGMCSLTINGKPHGGKGGVTTCQLHMREFEDGQTIIIEPFRARAFPVLKDLAVDRTAFDKIIQAGGYISVRTGSPQDANNIPISKDVADRAFNAAACIGCGACVAACKNASAMLFAGAKITHLSTLPQGLPEKDRRVLGMVRSMDAAGFGNCTNQYECVAVCPKEIPAEAITRLNRDYAIASIKEALGG